MVRLSTSDSMENGSVRCRTMAPFTVGKVCFELSLTPTSSEGEADCRSCPTPAIPYAAAPVGDLRFKGSVPTPLRITRRLH